MGLVREGILVLDCVEPERLAEFYRTLLDAEMCTDAGMDRIEIATEQGLRVALRRDLNAVPASWPRPDNSQQIHLDLLVDEEDMDAVERQVVSLGGRPLDTKDDTGPYEVRLYADPAGHPFSLRCSVGTGSKSG